MTRHRLIHLPVRPDRRGNLTFVEGGRQIPFDILRVFYLYDVPGGESRAGHALKNVEQVLVAVSGSFDVVLDYGDGQRIKITLNRPYIGLYLPSLVWRELENFSSGSVCLVFASDHYSEASYCRDYQEFASALSRSPE